MYLYWHYLFEQINDDDDDGDGDDDDDDDENKSHALMV